MHKGHYEVFFEEIEDRTNKENENHFFSRGESEGNKVVAVLKGENQ